MQLQIRKKDNRIMGYGIEGSILEDDDNYVVEISDNTPIDNIYWSYYQNGEVIFDSALKEKEEKEELKNELRQRREGECFSIVNRGAAWYNLEVNTPEKQKEFAQWYQAWLDVTDTLVAPEKPFWLK